MGIFNWRILLQYLGVHLQCEMRLSPAPKAFVQAQNSFVTIAINAFVCTQQLHVYIHYVYWRYLTYIYVARTSICTRFTRSLPNPNYCDGYKSYLHTVSSGRVMNYNFFCPKKCSSHGHASRYCYDAYDVHSTLCEIHVARVACIMLVSSQIASRLATCIYMYSTDQMQGIRRMRFDCILIAFIASDERV